MSEPIKKFYRSRTDRVIWGVCGGLADYFKIDSVLVRIIFILLAISSGFGVLLYVILALVIPTEPGEKKGTEKVKELADELSQSAKHLAGEINKDQHRTRNILGLIILFIGVSLLLQQAFSLYINWALIYPFLVIILGIYLIGSYGDNKK